MDSPSTDSVSTRHPLAVLRFLGLVLLGSGVGGVAALAAVGFVNALVWLNDLLLISPRGQMMADDTTLVVLATLLVPTFGGLLVGQLHRGLPGGRPIPLPTPSLPSRPAEVAYPPRLVLSQR